MAVPGFGYSFGDFATACVIIGRIIQAFSKARGARAEYRESLDFLRAMQSVIKYINSIKADDPLLEDNKIQIQMICEAYDNFHSYIVKFAKLDRGGSIDLRERAHRVLPTIRWSFHELNNKVQKMRASALEAVSLMDTLILLTMSSKMTEILEQGAHHESSLDATRQTMEDAEVLLSGLTRSFRQSQNKLDNIWQRDATTDETLTRIQEHCEQIQASHSLLEQNLNQLIQQLEDQANATSDSIYARELRILARRRRGQSANDFDLDKERETMDRMTIVTERMHNLTGSRRVHSVYEQFATTNHALETAHILAPMLESQSTSFPGKGKLIQFSESVKRWWWRLSRTQRIQLAIIFGVLWIILMIYFARSLRRNLKNFNEMLKAFARLFAWRGQY